VIYEDRGLINARPKDPNIEKVGDFLLIKPVPAFPKLGFDGMAGWMGYQTTNDLLFIKRFATYPDRPYNEVAGLTLSVWYPPAEKVNAVELEPIGPRNEIAPRQRAEFTEHWELEERRAHFPLTEQELRQMADRFGAPLPTSD
jgi:hypothetical protein